jgi:hypothetical protein
LLSFRQSVADDSQHACDIETNAPMSVVLASYLGMLSSERVDALAAGAHFQTIDERGLVKNDRELMYVAATNYLLTGDLYGATGYKKIYGLMSFSPSSRGVNT